jgi:hypothetical protein
MMKAHIDDYVTGELLSGLSCVACWSPFKVSANSVGSITFTTNMETAVFAETSVGLQPMTRFKPEGRPGIRLHTGRNNIKL